MLSETLNGRTKGKIQEHGQTRRDSAQSLQSKSCAAWEAQRTAAFELRGSVPVGIPQTQANRTEFVSMREDEFARYAERARQFTDGHKGIVV